MASLLRLFLLGIFLGGALLNSFAYSPGFSVYRSHGYMWAHRKTMLPLEAPSNGIDFNIYFHTQNSRLNWTRNYRSPRLGISFAYLDFGTDIGGKAFGILPFAELKLIDRPRQELNLRVGSGLGYLTKTWALDNLQNKAIGSHLNANMRVHFLYHLMFTKHLEFSAVFGITHFSNANYKMPNLGMNSVEAGIGLGYNFHAKAIETQIYQQDSTAKKRKQEFRLIAATKETGLVYTKRIFVAEFSYKNFFWCMEKINFSAGADFFYDQGYAFRDNPNQLKEKANLGNSVEVGLTLGGELLLGNLHLIGEGGMYAYSPKWNKGLIYQRVGMKYMFTPQLSASVTLKTHFARADYMEWGIGYTIFQH